MNKKHTIYKIKLSKLKRFNMIKDWTFDNFCDPKFEPSYEVWTFDNYQELKETLDEHRKNGVWFEYFYLDTNKIEDKKEIAHELMIEEGYLKSSYKIEIGYGDIEVEVDKDLLQKGDENE